LFVEDSQLPQQSQTIQPYYAPFKIPPSQVQSCFASWTKSLWFAPAEFLDSIRFNQIQGNALLKNIKIQFIFLSRIFLTWSTKVKLIFSSDLYALLDIFM
jgi:hypothetical protein